jgi:hypothetical protein
MSEVHQDIQNDSSGNKVRVHNPAVVPLAPNAGQPITAAVKSAGMANGNVQGQVPGATVSILFSNPAIILL